MAAVSIQDRTAEFHSILAQAQRRQVNSKVGAQRQSLLTSTQKAAANGTAPTARQRSEFARNAADISRRVTGVMARLQRLAELTKKKSLFNDQAPEINGLTEVIKRDIETMRVDLGRLSTQSRAAHPKAWEKKHLGPSDQDQVGEHEKSVFGLFTEQVANAALHLEQISEVRMQNAKESRERQSRFLSSVTSTAQLPLDPTRSDSPLYQAPARSRSPKPGMAPAQQDLLSLEPSSSSSALVRGGPQSELQLQLMEEGAQSNTYIQQRGEAIDTIQRTMDELGKIFGQLAQMVAEQGEEIQRIDANTEDIVDNVEGAQRELMKYWNRVSGNRWLVAKMFGVLMIFFLLWVLVAG